MKITIFFLLIIAGAVSAQTRHHFFDDDFRNPCFMGNHAEINNGHPEFYPGENFRQDETVLKSTNVQPDSGKKHSRNNMRLKLGNSVKQSLDSVVYEVFDEQSETFVRDDKEEYLYDSNGNLTSEIYQNWDETMKKVEYVYDSNRKLTLEIEYIFEKSSSQWVSDKKYEYTYYSNGNSKMDNHYIWDETINKWILNGESKYNQNGNLIFQIHYIFDELTSKWIIYSKVENEYDSTENLIVQIDYNSTTDKVTRKEENTYNSVGNLTSKIEFRFEEATNKWNITGKYEYTYDSNENLTSEIHYWQDQTYSKWVESSKNEYTNDSNGNPTLHNFYEWNEKTSKWVNVYVYKYENTYNSNGNQTSGSSYEWDKTTSKWMGSSKWEDGYDSYGNLIFESEFEWDETTSKWIVYYKDEYIYDNTYNFNDLILPDDWISFDNDGFFKHKITDVLFYTVNENTGQLYVESRGKLYYSEKTITEIDESKQKELRIYPNPASAYIDVVSSAEINSIKIFNSSGQLQLIQESVQSQQKKIPIRGFSNGIYFIEVKTNTKNFRQKLIVN